MQLVSNIRIAIGLDGNLRLIEICFDRGEQVRKAAGYQDKGQVRLREGIPGYIFSVDERGVLL